MPPYWRCGNGFRIERGGGCPAWLVGIVIHWQAQNNYRACRHGGVATQNSWTKHWSQLGWNAVVSRDKGWRRNWARPFSPVCLVLNQSRQRMADLAYPTRH
jgi:hypothetical protein